MIQLGDRHNFGRFVHGEGDRIFKPRSLIWEKLFLSELSPLRSYLDTKFLKELSYSPFEVAPNLNVEHDFDGFGSIEIAPQVRPLQKLDLTIDFAMQVGAVSALCFWFGIGDLHKGNMLVGRADKTYCFPLDIESAFDSMSHIKQTLLVPNELLPEHVSGLFEIIQLLKDSEDTNRIEFIAAFLKSIQLLNNEAEQIVQILLQEPQITKSPIRFIPRSTIRYQESIRDGRMDGYYDSEKIQLQREDIPYFFRFINGSEVFMYSSSFQKIPVDFSQDDFPGPTPILLRESSSSEFLKLKTAILSAKHLAKKINLDCESSTISSILIKGDAKQVVCKDMGSFLEIYLY